MSQENRRLDCQPYSPEQMVKRLTDLSANLYLQVINTFSVSREICSALIQQENKLSVTEMLHGTSLCCFGFHRATLDCLGHLGHRC